MAIDMGIRQLARATYDPRQFPGAYSDEKRRLQGLYDQRAMALANPNGTAANINNPDDIRSLAHQQLPGLFGPQALQPVQPVQQVQQQQQQDQPAGIDDMMRETYTDGLYNGLRRTKRTFSAEI